MSVDPTQEATHSPSVECWEEKNLKRLTKTEILSTDINTGIFQSSPTRWTPFRI